MTGQSRGLFEPLAESLGRTAGVMSLVLALSLGACKTTSSDPKSAEYSAFFSPSAHIDELLEQEDPEGAAEVYELQTAYFSKNHESRRAVAKRIAERLSVKFETRATATTARLQQTSWPAEQKDWPKIKDDEVEQYAILAEEKYRPKAVSEMETSFAELTGQMKESAGELFAGYPHASGEGFFDAYPIELEPESVLVEKTWGTSLQGLTPDQIVRIKRDYRDKLPENMTQALALAHFNAELAAPGGAKQAGLADTLRAVVATRRAGLKLANIPGEELVVAKISRGSEERSIPMTIQADMPGQLVHGALDKVLTDPMTRRATILVLFDIAEPASERDIVKYEKVQSEYRYGTQSVPNPDYAIAQAEVEQATIRYRQTAARSSMAGSQYCFGWGCLAQAIGQIGSAIVESGARSDLEEAMAKLRGIPSTVEKPVYKPYSFTKATVEASKVAKVRCYVIDRKRKIYLTGVHRVRDRKSFKVAYDLHKEDRYPYKHLTEVDDEAAVAAFEAQEFSVKMTDILDTVAADGAKTRKLQRLSQIRKDILANRKADQADLRADKAEKIAKTEKSVRAPSKVAKRRPPTSSKDSRLESTVILLTASGGLGSGFFVTEELVVTNYHVIEGSTLVKLGLHGGEETFGRLVAFDVRRDLALIRTQARGRPARFYDGPELPLGETVEAIGHPKGLVFSVTRGIISGVRELPSKRLRGQPVLFVQTDTPINSGNSGGPLFLDDKIVGVNTWKLADIDVEGVGFAVHYEEVLDFLRKHVALKGAGS